ncbi:Tim44/TimA family putative adaptor protein [Parasphingorhabdus halotolerans]|uniref:Tim44 domain-containing protein n=1 Tax=Parasphingorhabdus halotolerans TaxID=2725558 RepID=A0A6H2DRH8_9SPHN|nr:Tim44/TimA family putative adaptor protein [Parasphingorhabdus halotolerans]QJB70818.1 Tim44 domain-containing protein [Parasphingorhabdus halotolerans]
MNVTVEIIVLAMVAAFLGLRLYSVLGKRTGHEQEHTPRSIEPKANDRRPLEDAKPHVPDIAPAPSAKPVMVYESGAESGMRDILAADRNFDVGRFVEGAKAAYGMILEAFWKGDRDELKILCDDDIYASFDAAISDRDAKGEVLENRLVRIEDARISEAEMEGRTARITVRFDADIASVVKDKDGTLIGGSLSDAVETHDVWTFSRDLSSSDPNWVLDETDEA